MVALRNDRRGFAFPHLWETVLVVIMMVVVTALTSIALTDMSEREVERSLNDQRVVYMEFMTAQASAHIADKYEWAALWLDEGAIEFIGAIPFGINESQVTIDYHGNRETQVAHLKSVLESMEPAGYNTRLEIWVPTSDYFSFDRIEGFSTTAASKLDEVSTGNFRFGAQQYMSVAMRNGLVYVLVMAEEE